MQISVLGTGYLGATHAACLAAGGHTVIGVDTDPLRLELLRHGRAPFHEPGLDELLRSGVDSGRLRFTDDLDEVVDADVHFLCVGTPQVADGDGADLSVLHAVVEALAPRLDKPCLVVGKSTVPVGTAADLRGRLQRLAPAGTGVGVAWNPEFLREGRAVRDSLEPDRLVFGVDSDLDNQLLREVYADLVRRGAPVFRTDPATAELAKVSANAMLAARISLVNLLAEVCEASDADVSDLTAILGADPRIGSDFLSPGLGYGGGCLPKDTRAFVARARELGVVESSQLLASVDDVNTRQRTRTVELAGALVDLTAGPRVAVLGGAFKAGSDDVRDSPALAVASALRCRGAQVVVHDPQAGDNVRRTHPELEVCATAHDAVRGAELVLVLTEWSEFAALDPVDLGRIAARRVVVDGRLVLDGDKWRAADWDFHALGRGTRGAA
ncbi:UDP-glucose dehydrogenase family protein [Nocardioides sp. URHA0020]|uniref:UDP-glucose dehydrogenase family protein n=1 Tax=Nocardioides sp. URHA0020 TaxID=1380392 RepID=UPI0005661CD8|nr:UDP-glucose/GDP-mannose dehydrogenase family protein [Nocardioides sp. URHA0020]